jgi:hypothetical protein
MPVIQSTPNQVKLRLYWVGETLEDALTKPSFSSFNEAKFDQWSANQSGKSFEIFTLVATAEVTDFHIC